MSVFRTLIQRNAAPCSSLLRMSTNKYTTLHSTSALASLARASTSTSLYTPTSNNITQARYIHHVDPIPPKSEDGYFRRPFIPQPAGPLEEQSLETLTWFDGQMEEPLFDRLHKFPVSIYEALATFALAFGTVFAIGYGISEFVLPEPEVLYPRELYFDQIELGQKAAPNGQDDFNCKLPQV